MRIEVKDGCFGYPGQEREVLKDINFSLDTGDVLAILGPNGAGKTTLLRCTTGLLKWKSGGTFIDGMPVSKMKPRDLWKRVSYVPQAKTAPAAYTVEEMVLLGRAAMVNPFSVPSEDDIRAADAAVERAGISRLKQRSCAELSGGEFQMVLIARALASEPEVLILDEPESNLDFQNQLLVLNMISELASEGITCIFNTHYPAHALRRGTKALMLARDGSYCFGKVREMIIEENILKYFGVKSVIGHLETSDSSYADVVPIEIYTDNSFAKISDKALKTEKCGTTLEIEATAAPRDGAAARAKKSGTTSENEATAAPRDGAAARAKDSEAAASTKSSVIACITVMLDDKANPEAFNAIVHEYESDMVGRMGIPYRKAGINIITLTLDSTVARVLEMTDRISRLKGMHVKTSYLADR